MSLDRRTFLTGAAAAAGAGALAAGCTSESGSDESSDTPVPAGAVQDLRAKLDGDLFLADDDAFENAAVSRNARYAATRPVAVAQVAHAEDVATCVEWCLENGVAPVPRGGGHSYAGFSSTTGLIVSLAALNDVTIDASAGTVTVGGAALNRDLFDATVDGQFILPGGTCLGVGLGGLALGGGIGYNTRWAGLTADHMKSTTLVDAAGAVRSVSSSEDPDLLWACRGGAGGTFGINTDFVFDLVEVPRETISFFSYTWSGREAAGALLEAFDTLMTTCPDALNAVAFAEATEDGSGAGGNGIDVTARGLFIGSEADLRDVVEPLRGAVGEPTSEEVVEKEFWAIQRTRVTDESPPHCWGDVSRYATGPLPSEVYAGIAEALATCPHRSDEANGSFWSLGWVGGGVVGRFARDETAYVHRDATTLLRPTIVWPTDADDAVASSLIEWADDLIGLLAPHTPAESYQNFPNRRIADARSQYFAENHERLVRVKSAVDPTNLFNNPQSVVADPFTS